MNLPNKLTVFRMLLVIAMIIVAYIPMNAEVFNISINMLILNLIFITASITDKLDGSIARKTNQITIFGKFLDPIADKMLVLTAMLILVERNFLPVWIPVIILIREFLVSGYRLVAVENGGKVIAANVWGKIKTVTQMTAIICAFININNTNVFGKFIYGEIAGFQLFINIITTLAFILSVVATIISGYKYLKDGKDLLKNC